MKRIIFALLITSGFILGASLSVKGEDALGVPVPPIPNWSTWKCRKAYLSHQVIETHLCQGPEENQTSRIMLKVKGQHTPFLIGWGYDGLAANAREKTYSALYKDGKWIVGARGTGFTTEEGRNFVVFYIFLSEDFSVTEQLQIKVPEAEVAKVVV